MSEAEQLEPRQVVGAAIIRDGQVLCALRPPVGPVGGMWEFPGGKVEPGETHEQALVREIAEELGVAIIVGEMLSESTLPYPPYLVTLTNYYCTLLHDDEPQALEHNEVRWVPLNKLREIGPWPPLDQVAISVLEN